MTIAFWCVLVAVLLPYCFTAYAKFTSSQKYDNSAPRDFLDRLKGKNKRAHWVQLNSFEAFPPFAAAVIIAHLSGADGQLTGRLAMAFIVCRVFYGIFYIADKALARTLAWSAGMLCVIALFASSAF